MKKAKRISFDGSPSEVEEASRIVDNALSKTGPLPSSVRIADYEPDNPEILRSEAGKILKWLAGDERKNGNPIQETDDSDVNVEDEKFFHALKRQATPALKKLLSDVMFGPGGRKAWEERNNGTKKEAR